MNIENNIDNQQKRYVFVETTYVYGDCRLDRYLQFPDSRHNISSIKTVGAMAFHNGEATYFKSKEDARQMYIKYNCELAYSNFVLQEVYEDFLGMIATKSITD